MKKALIVMTVMLLAVSLTGMSVYAKAQQASFYNDGEGIDITIPGSGGKVIINLPKGKVGMVVQGTVRSLEPGKDYDVLIGSQDAGGNGSVAWYTGAKARK